MGPSRWNASVSFSTAVLVMLHLTAGPVIAETGVNLPDAVIVRYYAAPAGASTFQAARESAAAILRAAGVTVRWVNCTLETDDSAEGCAQPVSGNEIVLRIVGIGASPRYRNGPLGDAYVDVGTRMGSVATVYADRVAALADDSGVDGSQVMARAVAHEIGHLLLGTNQHANRGLMRPAWSGSDFRRNQAGDWEFSGKEAAAMQRGLTERSLAQ